MGIRQGCAYVGAWIMATTAAVVLAWFGVRDVLHDAMAGHVQPLPPRQSAGQPPRPPGTTSEPTPDSTTVRTSESPEPTSDEPRSPVTSTGLPAKDAHDSEAKRVRGYDVTGGRVVLAVHPDHVRLLSAVPNPGYEVRTWRNDQWLRVDLVTTGRRSAVFATWNDHSPTIRVVEY